MSLLILIGLFKLRKLFSLKHTFNQIFPILFLFIFLILQNILNKTEFFKDVVNIPFLLNIIILIISLNLERINKNILFKGLIVYAHGAFLMTIMYFLGFENETLLENRDTIFGVNQNQLGINLAIAIFIYLSKVLEKNSSNNSNKWVYFIPIPFLFLFMINTGSRSAFFVFLLGSIIYIAFKKSTTIKKVGLILAICLVALILWYGLLQNTFVIERIFDAVDDGDLSGRDLIWVSIIPVLFENFLFGIGETGYFKYVDSIGLPNTSPHNFLLEIFIYTGIFGFLLFLLFLYKIIKVGIFCSNKINELLPLVFITPILLNLISGQILGTKIIWLIITYILSKYTYVSINKKKDNRMLFSERVSAFES